MSQYRDERDASRHRIDALEDKLAERDQELAERDRKLAEQDNEIKMLERQLRDGADLHDLPVRRPAVAVAALGLVMMASIGAFGAFRWAATPASVSNGAMDLSSPSTEATRAGMEAELHLLEPKVFSQQASSDELKLYLDLCRRTGDPCTSKRAGRW